MKQIFFLLFIVLIGAACSTSRKALQIKPNEGTEEATDSLEYDLETFDVKFETWYALHDMPSQYRSQQYYENWNRQYVNAWNYKAMQPGNHFFEPIVGYDPTVDYGFELNHELFYYFLYVENELNIEIMPGGPKSIVF